MRSKGSEQNFLDLRSFFLVGECSLQSFSEFLVQKSVDYFQLSASFTHDGQPVFNRGCVVPDSDFGSDLGSQRSLPEDGRD